MNGRGGWQARFGRRLRLTIGLGLGLALVPAALAGAATGQLPGRDGAEAPGGETPSWVQVDYRPLVDGRRLTHSGESVATLLRRLGGRPLPAPGERPADALFHRLLDPLLEPYAFVLPDVLDSLRAAPPRPMVEIGDLWQPGEAQPAWVELLRARRYVLESDGQGRMRAFLPWTGAGEKEAADGTPGEASEQAGREAWESAWPVLRHAVGSEIERQRGIGREAAVEVEVFPYRHHRALTLFALGSRPYRVRVDGANVGPSGPLLDLRAWQSFLDAGWRLEGGRIDPDGTVRLLGSRPDRPATLLGRPISMADLAVAYRAVFHGGLGEPYMSLDRAGSPQRSLVNYGGRLRDTGLGLVSLLCDARFKTFSLGIDVFKGQDERDALRRRIPDFRTHLERFAADRRALEVSGQQTRLWFYPDAVDLTLSARGEILVVGRARMTAASERVAEETWTGTSAKDPPWTLATIDGINRHYDELANAFPELADLDEVVRLLSFFTWLRMIAGEGYPLPDLDALLGLELPSVPTPRTFPQLLTFNALPRPGSGKQVVVLDRAPVVLALDRLAPASGRPLPAMRRFRRALASLDRSRADHRKLAEEMEAYNPTRLDDSALDLLAYRAERLQMHRLVLSTLPQEDRDPLARRQQAGENLRVFSVGIGGLDLGMSGALARANRRSASLAWAGPPTARASASVPIAPGRAGAPRVSVSRSVPTGGRKDAPGSAETRRAPLPDHGCAPGSGERKGKTTVCEFRGNRIEIESLEPGGRRILVVSGADSAEVRSRRIETTPEGRVREIDRVEEGRRLRYRMVRDGVWVRVEAVSESEPPPRPQGEEPPALPAGLATLEVVRSGAQGETPTGEASRVGLALRAGSSAPLVAEVPRSILQRLVLGPDADLPPHRPLAGVWPLPEALGTVRRLLVLADEDQLEPPWDREDDSVPGEEDPIRLARALGRWASAEPGAGTSAVAVGTDPAVSPARWERAPVPARQSVLLLPDEAFPPPLTDLRGELSAAWDAGPVETSLSSTKGATVVVLVSGEDPGRLAARMRELARSPGMRGKLLAVYSLSGPIRQDLPASLVREGELAGIGVAEAAPVGLPRIAAEIGTLASALDAARKNKTDVVSASPLFLWFF